MSFIFSILPIVLLIWLMTKKKALPSYIALPLVALVVYLLQFFYFKVESVRLNARIVSALIATFTPISVIAGAICFNLFQSLSGATQSIRNWLQNISPNPVHQVMLVGWAFAFMIEGASGFGTPAAIAAPILVGLGFNPLKVVLLALVMNSVPVSFGAVGTPTWFGFSNLNLDEAAFLKIGSYTALLHSIAGLIIPVLALRFLFSWQEIKKNIGFIYISILSCTLPMLLLAQINYEFPSLVGGAIGLICSIIAARSCSALLKEKTTKKITNTNIIKAFTPTALLIFILLLTRIHQLGIKALLNDGATLLHAHLGFLGDLKISKSLILHLNNIFQTDLSDSYKILYVPALIPFFITILICIPLFKMKGQQLKTITHRAFSQIKKPFLALFGALIMVKLMLEGGTHSMVLTIGTEFSNIMGAYWTSMAAYLGAVGAFFSGSNTVSNLTFSGIQQAIALKTGLSATLILALQSVGGAMGNMVCINNIIAACTVLNIKNQEGCIIKKTAVPMLLYGVIVAVAAFVFF